MEREKRDTICGIFHVVSRFPLHFTLYRGHFDYILYSVPAHRFAMGKIPLFFILNGKPVLYVAILKTKHTCTIH